MLLDALIISSFTIVFWIARQPNELLSGLQKWITLNIEDKHPKTYKLLACPYCQSFWLAVMDSTFFNKPIGTAFISMAITYLYIKIVDR